MVESFLAVPLHFTTEFLGFLVMAGAAVLLFSRPGLIPGESSNRIMAGIGFGILAGAQVAHGGAFENFEVDGNRILIAARTLGLLLILIGLLGGLRTTAAAAVSWEIQEVWMLAPATTALLVSVVALQGSRGSGPKSLRRLSLGALLFGLGQAAGAAAPDAQFGAGVVSLPAYLEHGLEAAGFLAFAAWLRTAARASIRTRFVTAFSALLIAVVLALASALTGVISSNVQNAELLDVRSQLRGSLDEIAADTDRLKDDVDAISELIRDDAASSTPNFAAQARQARGVPAFDEIDFILFMDMDPPGDVVGYDGVQPTVSKRQEPRDLGVIDVNRIASSAVIDEVIKGAAACKRAARFCFRP